jgi:hypothetical protein
VLVGEVVDDGDVALLPAAPVTALVGPNTLVGLRRAIQPTDNRCAGEIGKEAGARLEVGAAVAVRDS